MEQLNDHEGRLIKVENKTDAHDDITKKCKLIPPFRFKSVLTLLD